MDLVLDILSWLLLGIGSLAVLIGSLGLVRLPDLFSRQHAAGMSDTLGAGFILAGLALQIPLGLDTARIVFIGLFLLLTSPVSSHALAQAALASGIKPRADELSPEEEAQASLPASEMPAEGGRDGD